MSFKAKGSWKKKWLLLVGVVSVIAAIIGFFAGRLMKSPQEIAAQTAAPTPTLITSKVDSKVVSDILDAQATVKAQNVITISGTGQANSSANSSQADSSDASTGQDIDSQGTTGALVTTKLPLKKGDSVREGNVAIEISGRPVFVLRGTFPAYRDLRPSMTGPDVTQLQNALADVGLLSRASVDGIYGTATKAAVSALYRNNHYEAQTTDDDTGSENTSLLQARAALTAARKAKDSAAITEAKTELAELESKTGAILPRNEVVFVNHLPATVSAVTTSLGSSASGNVMSLSTSKLVLQATIDSSQVGSLATGSTVTTDEKDTVKDCSVTSISEVKDSKVSVLASCKTDINPSLANKQTVIHLVRSTTKDAVMCVPIGALSKDSSGNDTVILVTGKDELSRVVVTPGLEANGYLQITPIHASELAVGDKVLIGGN
ncbi:MAG: peptidoglycan-binding protein [Bifidobacteriaceae bacterium]|jgi:peptidoglycan hydrolase-like protein with peptidoglycan-binding domain|nr:peptidoglycan-binding protein [Bifidobacteriaceae bacterium]MCI1978597.1 peptidoglycan-binding protein [Bifidobacteriaceae bacterium]